MSFPNRALVAAPIARQLDREFLGAQHSTRHIARIEGVATATHQLWDTLDQDFWTSLADPQLTIFPTLVSLRAFVAGTPALVALFKRLIVVARSDSSSAQVNVYFKRLDQMVAGDFWRVVRNDASIVTRNGPTVAGDVRPDGARGVTWDLAHKWAGDIAETLGD